MCRCIYHPHLDRLLAYAHIPIEGGPLYWNVYLWCNGNAMQQARECDGGKCSRAVKGLTCPSSFTLRDDGSVNVDDELGEIHFSAGEWDTEIVAHECQHATQQCRRVLGIEPDGDTEQEERLCYLNGKLNAAVHAWLWSVAPDTGWGRKRR